MRGVCAHSRPFTSTHAQCSRLAREPRTSGRCGGRRRRAGGRQAVCAACRRRQATPLWHANCAITAMPGTALGHAPPLPARDAPRRPTHEYEPRRPEDTLLHRVVRTHLPSFLARAAESHETGVPRFVDKGLHGYLRCARPPIAHDRLSELPDGRIALGLKSPWSDGSTHVAYEPVDFVAKLAALIPRPHKNLVLYHGVLAANSSWRQRVVRHGRCTEGEAPLGKPPPLQILQACSRSGPSGRS
jgi:Putative transposase